MGEHQDSLVQKAPDVMQKLHEAIGQMREELDDHRESINENTTEIQTNLDYMSQMEDRMDRIEKRLDEMCSLLVEGKTMGDRAKEIRIAPLTKREKSVFISLYALNEENTFVSYSQLARKLCISEALVSSYVAGLIEKGIPVVKKNLGKIVLLKLESSFKQLQAKENIVGLDAPLKGWIPVEPQ